MHQMALGIQYMYASKSCCMLHTKSKARMNPGVNVWPCGSKLVFPGDRLNLFPLRTKIRLSEQSLRTRPTEFLRPDFLGWLGEKFPMSSRSFARQCPRCPGLMFATGFSATERVVDDPTHDVRVPALGILLVLFSTSLCTPNDTRE